MPWIAVAGKGCFCHVNFSRSIVEVLATGMYSCNEVQRKHACKRIRNHLAKEAISARCTTVKPDAPDEFPFLVIQAAELEIAHRC